MIERFRLWGFFNERRVGKPRVLLAAGHGYGNVGDEAQCGAAVARWKRYAPGCKVTLFSPNPGYTEALHGEEVEWAPRVGWFQANTSGRYDDKNPEFYRHFGKVSVRLLISVQLLKRGLPLVVLNPAESRILQVLMDHDILHISGGGFLTGKTRSRLWENCLLMRVCQALGIPYVLTGHNIGVFKSDKDRALARKGLVGASYIGLRDKGISEAELGEIGIDGDQVESSCDDALLCPRLDAAGVGEVIRSSGGDPSRPWVAANFHYWGQEDSAREANARRFAEVCNRMVGDHGLQIFLIAMTPTDSEAAADVVRHMSEPAFLLPYSPDYKVVRGVIADSMLCFTMKHHPIVFAQGEQVPVVSVALDEYYYHKNLGALANTGDEGSLVDAEGFHSDQIFEVIRRVRNEAAQSKKRMADYCGAMREVEERIYARFQAIAGG